MLQSICLILENEFIENKEHSVRIDLKDILEEEGYFFSSLIQDPILGVKYDGDDRIEMELLYEAPDISKHLEKLRTILEKTISFVLPDLNWHSYSVEIRTNKFLAICVKAQVSEKERRGHALKMLVIELFAVLTLY